MIENPEKVLEENYKAVFGRFYNLTEGDMGLSQDLTQELMIRVLEKMKPREAYKTPGQFMGWVHRVAYNLFIDHCRAKKRSYSKESPADALEVVKYRPTEEANAEEKIVHQELAQRAALLVEALDAPQKQVFKMRAIEGIPFKEIVKLTGRSLGTVLGNYRYAKRNLLKAF